MNRDLALFLAGLVAAAPFTYCVFAVRDLMRDLEKESDDLE